MIFCWYRAVSEKERLLSKMAQIVPVVNMDQLVVDFSVSSVYIDGYAGVKRMVEHLIMNGHRKIAVIRALQRFLSVDSRYQGYVDALKENNIQLSEKLTGKSDFSVRGGKVATHRLLGNSKPAAIITVDDLMAHGSSDRQDWKPGESDKKYCF